MVKLSFSEVAFSSGNRLYVPTLNGEGLSVS